MINSFCKFSIIIILLPVLISAQSVSGRLVDKYGNGISGLNVNLYLTSQVYATTSLNDGLFAFNNITSVNNEQLPAGYSVSNNYPNPFNPSTRINISLPANGNVRISVYNILGQKVREIEDKIYKAGDSFVDLELNGLANGVYIAKITLDGKYIISRKMMLLYGSRHLISPQSYSYFPLSLPKAASGSFSDIKIDSIVVSGTSVTSKVFTNLPLLKGAFLNVGNLEIPVGVTCPESVNYAGKLYHVVQIGEQCWLKENIDAGTMINGALNQSNNGILEKYCYENNPNYCNYYGGLYQWDEAMLYKIEAGSRGICPEGYKIPAQSDWIKLESLAGGNALKAIGEGSGAGIGTNSSGFSALIGGYFSVFNRAFLSLGNFTYFWSSTEQFSSTAYSLALIYSTDNASLLGFTKESGISVRCLNDDAQKIPPLPSLSTPMNNSSSVTTSATLTWIDNANTDSYTLQLSEDSNFSDLIFDQSGLTDLSQSILGLKINTTYYWRVSAKNSSGNSAWSATWAFTTIPGNTGDPCPGIPIVRYGGKDYNTVLVGTQCWLKENLNIGIRINGPADQTNNGQVEKYCYNDDENNCNLYGALYQWEEAMAYNNVNRQGICPDGWHLPSLSDFNDLKTFASYSSNNLKSVDQGIDEGIGNNMSGFSALLAGNRNLSGAFSNLTSAAYFWTSEEGSISETDGLALYSSNDDISFYYSSKKYGVSVRCIKNQ